VGKIPAVKLTAGDVERMLRNMVREGLGASTIERTRSILRRALTRAGRDHGLVRNATPLAELPGGGTRRQSRAMTLGQVGRLVASELSPWWRAWIVAALGLGLRPGELGALRWSEVSLVSGVIRVRHSLKSGEIAGLKTEQSRRTIRMPADVVAALRALKAAQAQQRLALGAAYAGLDLVFAREDGRPMHRDRVRTGLAPACRAAGIPVFTTRECRHTFVSVMSDSGLSIEQIADAVGHKNSTITRAAYRHQIRDEISAVATVWDTVGSLARLPEPSDELQDTP
jgi:integrase